MTQGNDDMTHGEKIDKILAIVSEIAPMVREHRKTLYGNGQRGLKQDVVLMQQAQADCLKKHEEEKMECKAHKQAWYNGMVASIFKLGIAMLVGAYIAAKEKIF